MAEGLKESKKRDSGRAESRYQKKYIERRKKYGIYVNDNRREDGQRLDPLAVPKPIGDASGCVSSGRASTGHKFVDGLLPHENFAQVLRFKQGVRDNIRISSKE